MEFIHSTLFRSTLEPPFAGGGPHSGESLLGSSSSRFSEPADVGSIIVKQRKNRGPKKPNIIRITEYIRYYASRGASDVANQAQAATSARCVAFGSWCIALVMTLLIIVIIFHFSHGQLGIALLPGSPLKLHGSDVAIWACTCETPGSSLFSNNRPCVADVAMWI